MKRRILSLLMIPVVLTLMVGALPVSAQPVTQAEIEQAIEDGIDWLVGQQNDDGSWGPDDPDRFGTTGLILVKLQDRAFELDYGGPFDEDYPLKANVVAGLEYLLPFASTTPITPQSAGNPDTNANGLGVYVYVHPRVYNTAILMMAIAAGRDPAQGVTGGPLLGWTYGDVLQDLADWMAYAQTDSGDGRGGWHYQASDGGISACNSNAGYALLGILYARSYLYDYECTIPSFVATELNCWIDYIQNDNTSHPYHGGSGYASPNDWVNSLKTGNLLTQMSFVGDTLSTMRVQHALEYIALHWNSDWTQGWGKTGPVQYQAIYCVMKGLETMGVPLNGVPGVADWYQDMADALLAEQNADGSWPADNPAYVWPDGSIGHTVSAELGTVWALLTLQRFSPPVVDKALDYFKCYPNHWGPHIGEGVHLEDQFSAFEAKVGQPVLFANPVEKWHNGSEGPIQHPDHHFTFYRLDYGKWCEQWSVDVDNQFGKQNLTLSRPVLLAVPTQKIEPGGHEPPVALDHFLLYEVVEGTPVDTAVGLLDQFFEEPEVMVGSPIYFANPVRKTHGNDTTDIKNPEAHLVFYEIGGAQYVEPVLVLNQFGDTPLYLWWEATVVPPNTSQVDSPEPFLLGVPSTKVDFTVQYTLTITSTHGGSVTQPGEGTFWYEAGTVVNLVATPSTADCWFVPPWVGDVGTVSDPNAASTNISVQDCYTITARFRCHNCGLSTPVDGAPLALVVMGLVAVWAKRRHGNGSRNS